MIQLGRRLLLALGIAVLLAVVLWLALSWRTLKDVELNRLARSAALLAAQADSFLHHVRDDLGNTAKEIGRHDLPRNAGLARGELDAFLREHGEPLGLTGYALIAPDGEVVLASWLKPGARGPNLLKHAEWREDIELGLRTSGFHVGRPQIGISPRAWKIPLRYTVMGRDGGARFMLQTSLLIENQQMLWRNLAGDTPLSVGLLRHDGYLISRLPDNPATSSREKIYSTRVGGALFQKTRDGAPNGNYEGKTADGLIRYGAYQRLSSLPLYAFASLPESAFVAAWWSSVRMPLYLTVGFSVIGLIAFQVNARRYAARMTAIRLALAQTDPDTANNGSLPPSGVREIDQLCGALADTQKRLRKAMDNREHLLLSAAEAGTYSVRVSDGVVIAADKRFLEMIGKDAAEVVGKPWRDLLDTPPTAELPGLDRILSASTHRRIRFRNPQGVQPWLSLAEYEEQHGQETIRHGLAIDVTEREWLLDRLQTQSARLQTLWHTAMQRAPSEEDSLKEMLRRASEALEMDVAILLEIAGGIATVRHLSGTIPGISPGTEFPLRDTLCEAMMRNGGSLFVSDLAADIHLRDHPVVTQSGMRAYASMPVLLGSHTPYGTLAFLRRAPWHGEFTGDDRLFLELLALWFGQTLVAQRHRTALEDMAMTDMLTGLPNRRAAEARLQEELARTQRGDVDFCIAICDLDHFKLINDHYGHAVGDEVLARSAEIMRECLREADWIARWGGEEFLVFLHGSDPDSAEEIMQRLRLRLRYQPMDTSAGPLEITISIGIGVLGSGEQPLNDALAEADTCLYEAKHRGRDCVVVGGQAARSGTGLLWKAGVLRRALRDQRIITAYQPIVELKSGRVVADEALACLRRPDGSTMHAGEFIDAAESLALTHFIDNTVVHQAMARCVRRVVSEGAPGIAHFVNISPKFVARHELVEKLIADARTHCMQCNVDFGPAKPIVLELTEREFVSDLKAVRRDLQPLVDFGFRIALDDFGSGYSSFLYLAELPVSFIKIEGWMIQNMGSNDKVRKMVENLVNLAQRLGITTIAEWVENQETMERLRDMGVDWAQGYYFGRPQIEHTGAQDTPAPPSPASSVAN